MRARRPHLKSRNGCKECKRRRIKCDESKPSCGACHSRKIDCHYTLLNPHGVRVAGNIVAISEQSSTRPDLLYHKKSHGPRRGYASAVSPGLSTAPREDATFTALGSEESLDLMIQWFTSTIHLEWFQEISPALDTPSLCKKAMQHDYLKHIILALAALDLGEQWDCSGSKRARFRNTYKQYYEKGLTAFRSQLDTTTIMPANHDACIGFIRLATIFLLVRPKMEACHLERNGSPLEIFEQIISLPNGFRAILNFEEPTDMNMNLQTTHWKDPSHSRYIRTEAFASLNRLRELDAAQEENSVDEAQSHLTTINTLSLLLTNPNQTITQAISWIHNLDDKMVEQFKQRRPSASCIIGHYCVVLESFKAIWCLRDWDRGLLEALLVEMDPVYQSLLSWPRKVLGI